MWRFILAVAFIGWVIPAWAEEDPIGVAQVALDKAKTGYEDTLQRVNTDLEAAFDREIKKLRSAKKNITDQIAQIEKLDQERLHFTNDGTLPTAEALNDEVLKYKEALFKSRQKCEKAFDVLAQKYVAAKDNDNAKRILSEKPKFFWKRLAPGTFQVTTNPPFGLAILDLHPDGTFRQVQDEKAISLGTWERTGEDDMLLTYANTNYGTVKLKITDKDHLSGQNVHTNGYTWNWMVARSSSITFPVGDFACTTVPPEGEWTFSLNKDGTCTNTNAKGDYVCRGNWEQIGSEIVFRFAGNNYYDGIYSTGRLAIVDSDHLTGVNHQKTDGRSWKWTVVRIAAIPENK